MKNRIEDLFDDPPEHPKPRHGVTSQSPVVGLIAQREQAVPSAAQTSSHVQPEHVA
jgi:hypothetical protein